MTLEELRLNDLRQIKKALSTEVEILSLYIESPSTLEIVSSISVLASYGMSPDQQRDAIQAEIIHCKKLMQFIDICIGQKGK